MSCVVLLRYWNQKGSVSSEFGKIVVLFLGGDSQLWLRNACDRIHARERARKHSLADEFDPEENPQAPPFLLLGHLILPLLSSATSHDDRAGREDVESQGKSQYFEPVRSRLRFDRRAAERECNQ